MTATWPDQPTVDADTAVAALEDFKVAKWGQPAPLADGTCHCGRPIKYNLREGVIGHVDPAVNAACTEPWPDEPNPARWELSRGMGKVLDRLGATMDRATIGQVEPGDRLNLVTTDGEVHEIVVTSEPQADADGMVRFEVGDAERVAAMERITGIGAYWRRAVDGDTPGQCDPGHGPVQPIGLEPHHAAARLCTDEERAALEARALACASRDDLQRAAERVRQAMAPEFATGGVVEPARVGRWVVGQGWVPVDGLGPYEGATS